jgi:hypothetical protein
MPLCELAGKAAWRSGNHLVRVMPVMNRSLRLGGMAWNFGDILLTMLALFVWAALIWMFIGVFADLFRRTDLSGAAKAGWVVVIVVLPLVGILIYLIARPRDAVMDLPPVAARTVPASQFSAADEIEKARLLATSGAITQAEYETIKEQALARNASGR